MPKAWTTKDETRMWTIGDMNWALDTQTYPQDKFDQKLWFLRLQWAHREGKATKELEERVQREIANPIPSKPYKRLS